MNILHWIEMGTPTINLFVCITLRVYMHNGIVYGFIRCWKGHKTLKHFDYIHLIHGKRMIRRRLKIMANTRINYSIYTMFECVTRESHWTYIWWERVRVAVRCKMWSQTPTVSTQLTHIVRNLDPLSRSMKVWMPLGHRLWKASVHQMQLSPEGSSHIYINSRFH